MRMTRRGALRKAQSAKETNVAVAVAFVFMTAILILSVVLIPPPPPEPVVGTREGAILACQGAVRARLKAPATARFPSLILGADQYTVTRSDRGERFGVIGYVDAENSFGALLRTDFVCLLRFADGEFHATEVATTPTR